MNKATATRALEVYKELRAIDWRLEHLAQRHQFVATVEVWATKSDGNYPTTLAVPRDSTWAPLVHEALRSQLMNDRKKPVAELRELGFDVPPVPLDELPRTCTCHPADAPPAPCPQKFALSECRAAAWKALLDSIKRNLETYGEGESGRIYDLHTDQQKVVVSALAALTSGERP